MYIICISLGRPFLSLAKLPTKIQTLSLIHSIGIISQISMNSTTIFNLERLLASLSATLLYKPATSVGFILLKQGPSSASSQETTMNIFSKHYGQLYHPNHQIQVSAFASCFPLGSHCGLSQLYEVNLFKRPVTITFINLNRLKGRPATTSFAPKKPLT